MKAHIFIPGSDHFIKDQSGISLDDLVQCCFLFEDNKLKMNSSSLDFRLDINTGYICFWENKNLNNSVYFSTFTFEREPNS